MSASLGSTAPRRRCAIRRRAAGSGRCSPPIVVLWPLLVLAEFRPAALFETGHLQVMADFLRGFLPPSTRARLPRPARQGDARDPGDRHRRHRPRLPDRRAAGGAGQPRPGGLAHRPGAGTAPQRGAARRHARGADGAARDPRGGVGADLRPRPRPRPGRRRARARRHLRRHARQGLHRDPRIGRHPLGPGPARGRQRPPRRPVLRARAEHRAGAGLVHRLSLGVRGARLGGDGLRRRRRPRPADGPVDEDAQRRRGEHDPAHLPAARRSSPTRRARSSARCWHEHARRPSRPAPTARAGPASRWRSRCSPRSSPASPTWRSTGASCSAASRCA